MLKIEDLMLECKNKTLKIFFVNNWHDSTKAPIKLYYEKEICKLAVAKQRVHLAPAPQQTIQTPAPQQTIQTPAPQHRIQTPSHSIQSKIATVPPAAAVLPAYSSQSSHSKPKKSKSKIIEF